MKNKRKKFVELANKRVAAAMDKMRLIGNLADTRYYDYSEKDTKQIMLVLTKELNSLKSKFQSSRKKTENEFKLDI